DAVHSFDCQRGIPLRETSHPGKAGERNSGGHPPKKRGRDPLAAKHVLDQRNGSAFHSANSLGGCTARRKAAAFQPRGCRGRRLFLRAPLPWQSKDSRTRRQGLRAKTANEFVSCPARGPQV